MAAPLPFIGKSDAWPLLGLGAGIAASHPALAGLVPGVAAMPMVAGCAQSLAYHQMVRRLNRIDTKSVENFILKSDDAFGHHMGPGGIRLGYTRDTSTPLDIPNQFLQRHTAMVGQSGVGKTTLGEYILWQQSIRGGGWIFIDAKIDADTRDRLAYMMRLLGREQDLYVMNIDQPSNSNTYNPLLIGDPDEISSRLLNLLPAAENNPGADFYRQQAGYALTVLAGALKSAKYRYTFNDLSILLQSDKALEELERMPMEEKPKASLKLFLNQFKKKDPKGNVAIDINRVKEVLGGMSGRIALFAQGKFGEVMNTYAPEIDLTDIVVNNKCLYVMLPTMGKDQAALNLGKMILSDLRTAVYNIQNLKSWQRPNPPFLAFMDEMGSYTMAGIARLFEQARSANIMLLPAFQSFSQLASVSPEFADNIIQNTWNKIFFKFASKDSAETAAEIVGMTMKNIRSVSKGESEGESTQSLRTNPMSTGSAGDNVSESWREMESYKVSPDQLRALGIGESIIVSGARMFHIQTPMMMHAFPEGRPPEFAVTRYPTQVAQGERCLDLEPRYRDFLMQVTEDAPARVAREERELSAKRSPVGDITVEKDLFKPEK